MNKSRRRVAKRRRQAANRLENFMAARQMSSEERTNTRDSWARVLAFTRSLPNDQPILVHQRFNRAEKTINYARRYGMGAKKLAQLVGQELS